MASVKYRNIFSVESDGELTRDICQDDDEFAIRIAEALDAMRFHHPRSVPEISTGLQGNLCEFCVWELGESHWELYTKNLTWPANAKSPWRNNSKSGIDIIAIDENAEKVYIVEVKSTKAGGGSAISSNDNSLKADFRHLFEKCEPQERLLGAVGEVVSDLVIHGRLDLAEKVKDAVGHTAEECNGVHLLGVLVCKRGEESRLHSRKRAFQGLHEWLVKQGWQANQCEYRSIELSDFICWLKRMVQEATNNEHP